MVLQRIFSIPTDKLLLTFLAYAKPLRDFCGFTKVPDASKLTRFKQDFLPDLQSMFHKLVDLTEPICQSIDAHKASMTIFDIFPCHLCKYSHKWHFLFLNPKQ